MWNFFFFNYAFSLFALHLHHFGLCLYTSHSPRVRSWPVGTLQRQGCVPWQCWAPSASRQRFPPSSWAGMNVSGKMGPHSVWCDVFAFSEELAGWKLGFAWRGPLNLALAEGNNKVTDFIYLYAVCVASCAPCTTRPKSWHCDLALWRSRLWFSRWL